MWDAKEVEGVEACRPAERVKAAGGGYPRGASYESSAAPQPPPPPKNAIASQPDLPTRAARPSRVSRFARVNVGHGETATIR